ncbi:hypothetical protein R6Z07_014282 [Ovis aries]
MGSQHSCDPCSSLQPWVAEKCLATTEATVSRNQHALPLRCSPRAPPGGALCPPKRAGLELLRAGVGTPLRRAVLGAGCARGPPEVDPAQRPHRVLRPLGRARPPRPCPQLRPRPRASRSASVPGAAASLLTVARAPRRRSPPAPGPRARRARGLRGRGRPPRPACAGRRSSRAARRAAPRTSAALLPRCRLHARSQPDTDSAFSCRRIALEPPRRLRKKEKKKKKGKQQPGGRRSSARPELSPRSAEPPRVMSCPDQRRAP